MKTGIELISEERERQKSVEGWTQEHDAEHCFGELANAAACYAITDFYKTRDVVSVECEDGTVRQVPVMWPWNGIWWKPEPNDRIKELTKAGALIAAEIDRLLNEKNHSHKIDEVKEMLKEALDLTEYNENEPDLNNKNKEQ